MRQRTVLVVDDDPDSLASLIRVLKGAGLNVISAREGQVAIEEAKRTVPDLVLCDVMMPGLNGFQTTRKLKEDIVTANCHVVLMSGKTDPADVFWANEVGAVTLLKKPIDSRDLLDEIDRLLKSTEGEGGL